MNASRMCLLVLVPLLVNVGAAKADEYSKWAKDEKKQAYTCDYSYSTKDGTTASQTVVIYYGDKDRNGWAYYYNAKMEPWARCAVPGNVKYDPKQMYWQKLNAKADGYEDYPTKGYCPSPKDGKSAILDLPPPPK
jgi:hypothetical protein